MIGKYKILFLSLFSYLQLLQPHQKTTADTGFFNLLETPYLPPTIFSKSLACWPIVCQNTVPFYIKETDNNGYSNFT